MNDNDVALQMKWTREMIERQEAKRAAMPPVVYERPDVKVEPMGKAINRRMKRKTRG